MQNGKKAFAGRFDSFFSENVVFKECFRLNARQLLVSFKIFHPFLKTSFIQILIVFLPFWRLVIKSLHSAVKQHFKLYFLNKNLKILCIVGYTLKYNSFYSYSLFISILKCCLVTRQKHSLPCDWRNLLPIAMSTFIGPLMTFMHVSWLFLSDAFLYFILHFLSIKFCVNTFCNDINIISSKQTCDRRHCYCFQTCKIYTLVCSKQIYVTRKKYWQKVTIRKQFNSSHKIIKKTTIIFVGKIWHFCKIQGS